MSIHRPGNIRDVKDQGTVLLFALAEGLLIPLRALTSRVSTETVPPGRPSIITGLTQLGNDALNRQSRRCIPPLRHTARDHPGNGLNVRAAEFFTQNLGKLFADRLFLRAYQKRRIAGQNVEVHPVGAEFENQVVEGGNQRFKPRLTLLKRALRLLSLGDVAYNRQELHVRPALSADSA